MANPHKGDDVDVQFTITDAATNGPLNIGAATEIEYRLAKGAGVVFEVKKLMTNGASEVEITDGPNGEGVAHLTAADTAGFLGKYRHQVRLTLGGKTKTVSDEDITFDERIPDS